MVLLRLSLYTLYLFPADGDEDIPRYALKPNSKDCYEGFFPLTENDTLQVTGTKSKTNVKFQGQDLGCGDQSAVEEFKSLWDGAIEFLGTVGEKESLTPGFHKRLAERESEFIEQRELKLRYITWNLAGEPLYTTADNGISELFKGDFDVVYVAFQEVIPLNAKNFRSSQAPVDSWAEKILSLLGSTYRVINTNKLLGLASILISKKSLFLNFSDIHIDSIGTGVLNLFGNKGAIATSFSIREFNFTLLDCHFAAGESEQFVLKRRRELSAIKSYIKLPQSKGKLVSSDPGVLFDVDQLPEQLDELEIESDEEQDAEQKNDSDNSESTPDEDDDDEQEHNLSKIETQAVDDTVDQDKNIIIIGGDLNYRIHCRSEKVSKLIKEGDFSSLLQHDALTRERSDGSILQNFTEGDIQFPPSYKINKGTGEYDLNRTPSYTDRILHSESEYCTITSYESPKIVLSDHRPVICDLSLKLPLINNEVRDKIVTGLLSEIDEKENTRRTTLDIKDLETTVETQVLTPSTIRVHLENTGHYKTYWEIMDAVDNIDSKTPIKAIRSTTEPQRGVLPKTGEQWLSFTTKLPIGCKSLTKTVILRAYTAQDYFLTLKWIAKPSYFGVTLDELHGDAHGGIPQPIYTLINYLSTHLRKEMFNEKILSFTNDLENKIIQWINEGKPLDKKELAKADEILNSSSSMAVARVLLLLLRNLDGGVVPENLTVYLLDNFQDDEQVMERILENLPPLRANVLIYIGSFLRLCVSSGLDKEAIIRTFEPLLLQVPQRRKRDMLFGFRKNYEKLGHEFMEILVD
ncbi:unnamed protein product [Cyberlindnera jadinii]|uniref:Rho-GAP domain-containing protein n=1 Tax=Cyberlindnera jadinii (strain ATCC 18201 / CBS 1600 / BCRC 20928 / JCM 3617 / NBRC 0987 / NRRL Y-1542) TaxID=983966 RepID=A0A0H5C1L1_CYBJN|nr:unnamed protein product [Cyberlindnera jadinii]